MNLKSHKIYKLCIVKFFMKDEFTRKVSNKLNLGCGRDIREDYINLDFERYNGIDVIHDLNKFPYPFKDNTFEEILAMNIMEHLNDPNKFIKELWRMGKNNCRIRINVPHFSSRCAWIDLTHKRPFSFDSFEYYSRLKNSGESSLITNDEVFFKVDYKPIMNRFYRYIGMGLLAKKFSRFYETFLCFIFTCGGIEFNLVVLKK
jgi:SAM-dependent methyltransferase